MLQLRTNFKMFCSEKLVPGMGSISKCVSLSVHSPGHQPLPLPTLLLDSCLFQVWLLLGLAASCFGLVLSFLRCFTSLHPINMLSRGWRSCAWLFVSWARQSSRCSYSITRTCYLGPFLISFLSGSFTLAFCVSTLSPFVKNSLYTLHHGPVFLSVLILPYSIPLSVSHFK